MVNLISAEFYKLARSRAFYVLVLVVAFMASLTAVGFNFVPEAALKSAFGGLPLEGGQLPFVIFKHTTQLLVICLGVFAGIQVSGEFDNGTVKNPLAVGRRRVDYFIGKFFASLVACVLFVLVTVVLATLIMLFRLDWLTPVDASYIGRLMAFLSANVLMLLAYSQIFTMVALLVRNLGGTIGIGVSFAIIEGVLANILTVKRFEDVSFLKEVLPNTSVLRLGDIGSHVLPNGDYWKVLLSCVMFIVACGAVSLVTFYKRDIK